MDTITKFAGKNDQITVPARLARRPVQGSLVIPYMTYVGDDGIAQFRVNDGKHVATALERRLCALCGEPLEYWMVFIGGPVSIQQSSRP